jgi:mannan endo-1,4-beta-mannosidase
MLFKRIILFPAWMLLAALVLTGCSATDKDLFVKVSNGMFAIGDSAHYFMGTNYWYGGILALTPAGRKRLTEELDFLKANHITNLRVLAAAEGTGIITGKIRVEPAFQPKPGAFEDSILNGLDFLLAEMGKRDMKAVLYLSNNWEWSGGFLQYLNWGGILPDSILVRKLTWDENRDWVSKFYDCEPCTTLYNQQVEKIVTRVNSITGKPYRDDPAIFSWELANEPRPMRPAAIPQYTAWVNATAGYIKKLDCNHLVTTGCEGTMGVENMEVFESIHRLEAIDYTTIHIWPKNWGWFSDTAISQSLDSVIQKSDAYIDMHAEVSKNLGKPLVIEEFGLPRDLHSYKTDAPVSLRNRYYASVFSHWASSVQNKGIIAGFNFWAYGGVGKPGGVTPFFQKGDDLLGDPPQEEQGLNAVFNTDTVTWNLIGRFKNEVFK